MQSLGWSVRALKQVCHRKAVFFGPTRPAACYSSKHEPGDSHSQEAAVTGQDSSSHHTQNDHRKQKHQQRSTAQRTSLPASTDKEWSEMFETLGDAEREELENARYRDDEADADDTEERPFQRLSHIDRKHSPHWYGRQIEKLDRDGKIYEAIAVLEQQMLVEDRVMPNEYVFTALIGALGRVGYTKKAFSLFNKMKKFGLTPEDPTYTALFNVCSNSPWKEDGLQRANKLRDLMASKDHTPNHITFRAMIKAYALLGDTQTAFSIADEIDRLGIKMTAESLSAILMAAMSDKEVGLRYAIQVWKRFRKRGITPDRYSYNLLLRIVRDCHIGDPDLVGGLLGDNAPPHTLGLGAGPHGPNKANLTTPDKMCTIGSTNISNVTTTDSEQPHANNPDSLVAQQQWFEVDTQAPAVQLPDILNPKADFTDVIGIGRLESPEQRLALLGGMTGFLDHMRRDSALPTVQTFTLLLDMIPQSVDAEQALVAAMGDSTCKPDVAFFNLLIRRRNLRKDFGSAKAALDYFSHYSLVPDMATYGCLAMGCSNRGDGLQLLQNLHEQDIVPSIQLWGILIRQTKFNFHYKLDVVKRMKGLNVKPNEIFLKHVEVSIAKAKKLIVTKEQGKWVSPYIHSEHFTDGFRQFMLFYKAWLSTTEYAAEQHPWSGFTVPSSLDTPNTDAT